VELAVELVVRTLESRIVKVEAPEGNKEASQTATSMTRTPSVEGMSNGQAFNAGASRGHVAEEFREKQPLCRNRKIHFVTVAIWGLGHLGIHVVADI
jgi:hypothetical protein